MMYTSSRGINVAELIWRKHTRVSRSYVVDYMEVCVVYVVDQRRY